jgi:hypothetical protein
MSRFVNRPLLALPAKLPVELPDPLLETLRRVADVGQDTAPLACLLGLLALGSLLALLGGLQGFDQPLANPTDWVSHTFTSYCEPSCTANRGERCCSGVRCVSGFRPAV